MRLAIKESDVQAGIMGLLAAHRIFAFRINTGQFSGEYKGKKRFVKMHSLGNGAADILALVPLPDDGWEPVWIECKAPGKVQRPEQVDFQKNVEAWGHRYLLLSSLDDAIRELKL